MCVQSLCTPGCSTKALNCAGRGARASASAVRTRSRSSVLPWSKRSRSPWKKRFRSRSVDGVSPLMIRAHSPKRSKVWYSSVTTWISMSANSRPRRCGKPWPWSETQTTSGALRLNGPLFFVFDHATSCKRTTLGFWISLTDMGVASHLYCLPLLYFPRSLTRSSMPSQLSAKIWALMYRTASAVSSHQNVPGALSRKLITRRMALSIAPEPIGSPAALSFL